MSRPVTVPGDPRAARVRGMDRWIGWATAATVAGLAAIAGALSYSQMRQLAQDHGQAGWHAHAFPLSVDGIEVVASLVLLAERRTGRRSGWLPWAALVIGTVGSLAANVATAGPGMVSRVIAGWPALALLIAVKLLSGMLGQHPASALAAGPAQSASYQDSGDPPRSTAMPIPSGSGGFAGPPVSVAEPGLPGDSGGRVRVLGADARSGPVSGVITVADLLPAARAARDGLYRDGRRLTRDALGARLRDSGCPVGNARLTLLLNALRSESATPVAASTKTAA